MPNLSPFFPLPTRPSGVWDEPTTGRWLDNMRERLMKEPPVNAKDKGAAGDGVTDDTAAIQSMFTAGAGYYIFPKATYKINSDVTVTNDAIVDFCGSTVTGAGHLVFQGSATEVGAVNSVATAGDETLVLTAVGSLATNDLLEIWDDVNKSWAPYDNSNKAGEFQKVLSVSGTTVTLQGALEDGYASASTSRVYKVSPVRVVIKNLNATSTGVSAFELIYCAYSHLENLYVTGGTNQSIALSSCYNLTGVNVSGLCTQTPDSLQYGINIASCQNLWFVRGVAHGRHGIATGNSQRMPCRHLTIEDYDLSCPVDWSVAADFHVPTADSVYRNCRIYGGIVLSGKDCGFENCLITAKKAGSNPIGYLSPNGGTLYVRNCKVKFAAGSNPTEVIASYSGSTDALQDVLTRFDIDGLDIDIDSSLTKIALLAFGQTPDRPWRFNNIRLNGALTSVADLVSVSVSVTAPSELSISNLYGTFFDPSSKDYIAVTSGSLGSCKITIPNSQGTFTPSMTFATPGDVSVTYGGSNAAVWRLIDGIVHYRLYLDVATMTYTTASGALTIGGFPIAADADQAAGNISFLSNDITYPSTATWLTPVMVADTKTMFIVAHKSATASANVTAADMVTANPPTLLIAGSYRAKLTGS